MSPAGYSISGIGYPMMPGLGNLGLSLPSSFASYDNYIYAMNGMGDPTSMLGMSGMMPGAMSMNGSIMPMGGIYNPLFMNQMQQAAERSRLDHTADMHTGLMHNEVQAYRETDQALINKMLTNSSVQTLLSNLRREVKEGKMDGIVNEFDKLREQILHTYADEIEARGTKENPRVAATYLIEALYSNIVSTDEQRTANLREDIVRYGEGAFENGFYQGFRKGHGQRHVADVMNHCFGLEIEDKGSKDFQQGVGNVVGKGASVVEKAAYGAAVGAGAYTIGGGIISLGKKCFGGKLLKFAPKWMLGFAAVGAVTAGIADLIWKCTGTRD